MVLVHFTPEQRNTMLELQKFVTKRYLGFVYNTDGPGKIPSLGEDYSPAYGYAKEHHTLETWLNLSWHYNKTSSTMVYRLRPDV